MKAYKLSKSFYIVVIAVVPLVLVVVINSDYRLCIREQKANLLLSRRSIRLYAEKHGKFPESLDESELRDETDWNFHPMDLITKNSTEHSILNGTGGLYYDPNNGDLKLNLTKPLKSYWIFYFGKKRNDVPGDW